MHYVAQNCVTEWSYSSGISYPDPFNDVQLDVRFIDPDGDEQLMPAFWAGAQMWGVRFSSGKPGRHHFRTICSDTNNRDLHGCEGIVEVQPFRSQNALLQHGPLRLAAKRRHLEHRDGTPFFWLGDTWWWCPSDLVPFDSPGRPAAASMYKTLIETRAR